MLDEVPEWLPAQSELQWCILQMKIHQRKKKQIKLGESDFNSATTLHSTLLGLNQEPRCHLWYWFKTILLLIKIKLGVGGDLESVHLGYNMPQYHFSHNALPVCISAKTRICLFYLSRCILLIFLRIQKLVIDSAFSVKKKKKWKNKHWYMT